MELGVGLGEELAERGARCARGAEVGDKGLAQISQVAHRVALPDSTKRGDPIVKALDNLVERIE